MKLREAKIRYAELDGALEMAGRKPEAYRLALIRERAKAKRVIDKHYGRSKG